MASMNVACAFAYSLFCLCFPKQFFCCILIGCRANHDESEIRLKIMPRTGHINRFDCVLGP